ncbi:hypothetical protein BDV29DRAFT_184369 [Aspergillus leporis]|uniref:Uncharacterized protein n=1 Tax=Aspergillus leporis TaxID=41062 RepID=A0A5N5WJ77_9EURO|nr:hypothetical protein BDV29DRAFT_184369 [Aspergillus leporis]
MTVLTHICSPTITVLKTMKAIFTPKIDAYLVLGTVPHICIYEASIVIFSCSNNTRKQLGPDTVS